MIDVSDSAQLKALAEQYQRNQACPTCKPLVCPGWESMPSGFQRTLLEKIASLRPVGAEPTLEEFHPDKTNRWSEDAPIAMQYHPYNLCDLYRCTGCSRIFLVYTEYGGYYEDLRIRLLDARLIA